tara:strand:- start:40 stop:375 length:336 start_codon:yes stop_codon:yes gene_type:complete
MYNFAIIEKKIIVNVIFADDLAVIETFFPSAVIVEVTDTTGPAFIGLGYSEKNKKFLTPQPFASWVLDESTSAWAAPASYPVDGKNYYWSEPELSWVEANFDQTELAAVAD